MDWNNIVGSKKPPVKAALCRTGGTAKVQWPCAVPIARLKPLHN
jgi:hypothetical protein